MELDWQEDSSSGGSSASPKTQGSGDARDLKPDTLHIAGWELPSLSNGSGNTLELFDGPVDGFQSTKFSFTGEGLPNMPSFVPDTFGEYGAPRENAFDTNSDALLADLLSGEHHDLAFDHIGMTDDPAPPVFGGSSGTAFNGLLAADAWDSHGLPTSAFVQPSELTSVVPEPHFEVPAPRQEASAHAQTSSPVLSTRPAGHQSAPAVVPKLKRRTKDAILPPMARAEHEVAGQLGLLVLGLKPDPTTDGERTYHSRVETSLRLNLVLAGTPQAVTASSTELDAFGEIPQYADMYGSLRPEIADNLRRVGKYRYIKLDKSSPVFRRNIYETPAAETVFLESHIYFASHPDEVVPLKDTSTRCNARASKGCIPRELKRWVERVNGNRRSQADAKEELLTGLSPAETDSILEAWIDSAEAMMYNDAEIQDFSDGCVSVQLRILHYARCFSEDRGKGYYIIFTMRNHLGEILAQASTPSIFMTDNHKGSSAKTSVQVSPVDSSVDELSASSSRGSRRSGGSGRSAISTSNRPVRRSSSVESGDSASARPKRALEAGASDAKRRKSSGFASRSSLSMTPREPFAFSSTASPTHSQQRLSEPASPRALSAELARVPNSVRETSPSTETSTSALSSPPPTDVIASLHRAEQQAPLVPPQRNRISRPHIEDVIPSQGSVRGGARIAVIGSGFRQGSVVYFGLTPAQTEHRGGSSLVCTLPPAPTSGPVRVNFGTGSADDPTFTYIDDTEQMLTSQSVSVVAAMLGLTSLDLSARFEELRKATQGQPEGMSPHMSAPSPRTSSKSGSKRSRRASIGEQTDTPPMSPPPLKTHSRTRSLTELNHLNPHTLLPLSGRKPKANVAHKAQSTKDLLVSLFELPDRRVPAHLFAQAVIRESSPEGQNVLHLAAIRGYGRLVELLVARGAPLDLADVNGMSALHFATLHGRIDVIRFLIDAGAPTNKRNSEGLTPFKIAEDVLEREDVVEAFPLAARTRSMASSQSSLVSYFASDSDLSEEFRVRSHDRRSAFTTEEDGPSSADEDIPEPSVPSTLPHPLDASTLSKRNLRAHVAGPASPEPIKSDDEDTLVDSASIATARPSKSSLSWFKMDTENIFWSPVSTAWWQPRRATEAPQTADGPPAPRMYGPSEATILKEKAATKMVKAQAALSRRLDYAPGRPKTSAKGEDEGVNFRSLKEPRTFWHDRRLSSFWLPVLLMALAYFLHSASLLPVVHISLPRRFEDLLPRAVLDAR